MVSESIERGGRFPLPVSAHSPFPSSVGARFEAEAVVPLADRWGQHCFRNSVRSRFLVLSAESLLKPGAGQDRVDPRRTFCLTIFGDFRITSVVRLPRLAGESVPR